MERPLIVEKLRHIIRPYLDDPQLIAAATESSELVDHLNINSMHMIDIVIELEDAFDIEVDDTDLDNLVSIGHVVDLVERKTVAERQLIVSNGGAP